MAEPETRIIVDHISKNFRVYKDKSHTLKDKVLFSHRNAYRLHKVLDDVSFTVHSGEAVGLIGHNGCGKSTTLKLLNKILYPDAGRIISNGKISSLIELGAGFHPDMSGRENVYINGSIFGLKKKEIDARFDDIVRFSELEDFIDNPVRTYSSGMYMRLAFSIAINVNADILLIDEILAVGDANFQTKCFNKLKEIKKNGAAIVIVSHSMSQIRSICDKTIWLEQGRIQESGPSAEVTGDYLFAMRQEADKRARFEAREEGKAVADSPMEVYPPQKSSSQCCPHAQRNGDMSIVVNDFLLAGENGKPQQIFTYGLRMKIFFQLRDRTQGKKKKTEPEQSVSLQAAGTDLQASRTETSEARMHVDLSQEGSTAASTVAGNDFFVSIQFFSNETGTLCCTFNSLQETGRYMNDANGSYLFTIDRLNLAQGDYFVTMHVKRGMILTDSIWHFVDFHVDAPEAVGEGVCAMENQWERTGGGTEVAMRDLHI